MSDNIQEVTENAQFDNLVEEKKSSPVNDLDLILNLTVTLSVVIGKTEITINELLKINQGSVIELDRLAGQPLDIMVNGTLVAHGEVVVVGEKFGIRFTEVISPKERLEKLE